MEMTMTVIALVAIFAVAIMFVVKAKKRKAAERDEHDLSVDDRPYDDGTKR